MFELPAKADDCVGFDLPAITEELADGCSSS